MSFAINKTPNTLVLKGGYISIPHGGHIKVSKSDQDHPHFQDAEARGWIEYSEHAPSSVPEAPQIEIATSLNDLHGMTEAQLLADKEKSDENPSPVRVDSIGGGEDNTVNQPDLPGAVEDSTAEVTTEVTAEVGTEPKPAKKARASKAETTESAA